MPTSGTCFLRRPSRFDRAPDLELDLRRPRGGAPSTFKDVLDGALRLGPGGLLSVRMDFEPSLLDRMLSDQGFEHWLEPLADEQWIIYFLRRTDL